MLFGELLTTRPFHGPKLWWRDVVLRDVQRMELVALNWYEEAKDRSRWYDLCQTISSKGVARGPIVVTGSFVCGCERTFNCSGDLNRHCKCCSGQPPPPKQTEFYLGYGRMFHRKSNLTQHQQYWSSSSEPGPCYCQQTGR